MKFSFDKLQWLLLAALLFAWAGCMGWSEMDMISAIKIIKNILELNSAIIGSEVVECETFNLLKGNLESEYFSLFKARLYVFQKLWEAYKKSLSESTPLEWLLEEVVPEAITLPFFEIKILSKSEFINSLVVSTTEEIEHRGHDRVLIFGGQSVEPKCKTKSHVIISIDPKRSESHEAHSRWKLPIVDTMRMTPESASQFTVQAVILLGTALIKTRTGWIKIMEDEDQTISPEEVESHFAKAKLLIYHNPSFKSKTPSFHELPRTRRAIERVPSDKYDLDHHKEVFYMVVVWLVMTLISIAIAIRP